MGTSIKVQIGRTKLIINLFQISTIMSFTSFYAYSYSQVDPSIQHSNFLNLFLIYIFVDWTNIFPHILDLQSILVNYKTTLPECVWYHRQTLNHKYFIPFKFIGFIASVLGAILFFIMLNHNEAYVKIDKNSNIWISLQIAGLTSVFSLGLNAYTSCYGVDKTIFSCCCNKKAGHCVLCMKHIKHTY